MHRTKRSLESLGIWLGCLVGSGMAQDGGTQGSAAAPRGDWGGLLSNPSFLLLLLVSAFYLLLIVPNMRAGKKAQRELEQRLANLKKNDRVVTSFGVHGVVAGIDTAAKTVILRLDETTNAKMTVNRDAIRVVNKD